MLVWMRAEAAFAILDRGEPTIDQPADPLAPDMNPAYDWRTVSLRQSYQGGTAAGRFRQTGLLQ